MPGSSSSSGSIGPSGPSNPPDPSLSSGTTAITRIACYTSSASNAAATHVDFPTALLTAAHSVAQLPNKDVIFAASPDPAAFLKLYNDDNNAEMDKLETLDSTNCHMAIYAWHAFAQIPDKEENDVKSKIVTQSLRRISTNPTYLANSLIAYSAMACRGDLCINLIPTYCFHRVPKPLMGCSPLLQLLLQRLDQLLTTNQQAKAEAQKLTVGTNKTQLLLDLTRWKLTGSDVVKEANKVLAENPLVQEIHGLRIKYEVLEYDVSIRQTDKQKSDDTPPGSEEKAEVDVEDDDEDDAEEKLDDGDADDGDIGDAESSKEELDVSERGRRRTTRSAVKAKPATAKRTPKRIEHWVLYASLQTTKENKKLVSEYNRLRRVQSFDCISYKKRSDGVTTPEIVWKNGDRVEVNESVMECLGWSDALWLQASQPQTSLTSAHVHGNHSNGNGFQNEHDNGNDDNDDVNKIVLKPSDEFFTEVQRYIEKLKSDKAKLGEKKQPPKTKKRETGSTNSKDEVTEKRPKNKPNAASTNDKDEVMQV